VAAVLAIANRSQTGKRRPAGAWRRKRARHEKVHSSERCPTQIILKNKNRTILNDARHRHSAWLADPLIVMVAVGLWRTASIAQPIGALGTNRS